MPMSSGEQVHLAPGYRLDRYELLCPIGVGGMASVWVARLLGKHGFEKLVAIKTILPKYASDPTFQQMFMDEARIAARIQHVNVAQILDLGDHHGVLFLVMEWVDGEALSRLARAVEENGAPFPPGIAMRILADVCAGLHAAHELRDRSGASLEIVHRDVSPHNILVGPQGVAKVIDFGIAKARDRAAGDTRTGSFKGKVKYMAPEQAIAPKTTDHRADLWAVGAVLYTLLAGRSPYESENEMATLVQLAMQKPPAPLPPEITEPIRKIVSRSLAWDPGERYASAQDLKSALEVAMRDAGVPTTTADVAAFCALHLADRVQTRQKAIAIALSAAEDRSRVERLLEPEDSSGPRVVRPSQPKTSVGERKRRAPSASEAPSPRQDTWPTLGAAGTMTFSPPKAMRRYGIAAAAGALAMLGVSATFSHRAAEPKPSAGAVRVERAPRTEAPATPVATVLDVAVPLLVTPVASVPVAPVPAASADDTAQAPATASDVPPSPGRRRPGPPRTSEQIRGPSGAAAATTKHRADYGF
jgi:serine/threonine protein kinase